MNQPTSDANTSAEGAQQTSAQQTSAQPKPRPRRPLSRAKKAAQEQAAAPVSSPAASASAPEQSPVAETLSAPVEAAPAQTTPPATTTPAKGGRNRPRRSGGQRPGNQPIVQLVKPATPETAPETPTTGEPLPATIAASEQEAPRIVPVVTEPSAQEAGATAPLALNVAGPSSTVDSAAASPVATTETMPSEQDAAPSRYRFGRRSTPLASAPGVRQERLSGTMAAPTTPAEEQPPREEANPSASAAEAAPTAELRIGPETRQHDRDRSRDAIADIVSALGLQDLEARHETPRAEEPPAGVTAAQAEPAEVAASANDSAEAAEDGSSTGEAEATSGRRPRRRRRRGSGHAATGNDEETEDQAAETSAPLPFDEHDDESQTSNGYLDYPDAAYYHAEAQPYSPYDRSGRAAAQSQEWDIGSGTQQLRQRESPFGAPEPSFARGFGPQPRGVAGPVREPFTRTGRTERPDTPPMSPNVLASTVTHAIQQQTDRLLAELRHQATPPAMTVMLPTFPSTERVGVFVDVANLLYSSRNLRVSIDFGRLLDFLRGNRRLIRAHAYAPTNPDPHAEQSFLSAVKGLGYRITTKNYKTFSSGAKKADMDLDLCMDIVRLVDAGALDTVVLVSGDSDFLPLLEYCSDHGVRVEVAAFEDAAAMILRQSCDLFVNLSLVDEIRA